MFSYCFIEGLMSQKHASSLLVSLSFILLPLKFWTKSCEKWFSGFENFGKHSRTSNPFQNKPVRVCIECARVSIFEPNRCACGPTRARVWGEGGDTRPSVVTRAWALFDVLVTRQGHSGHFMWSSVVWFKNTGVWRLFSFKNWFSRSKTWLKGHFGHLACKSHFKSLSVRFLGFLCFKMFSKWRVCDFRLYIGIFKRFSKKKKKSVLLGFFFLFSKTNFQGLGSKPLCY